MLKTVYGYLSRFYFFYFLIFFALITSVISLFEALDFIQKSLSHIRSTPMIVFWRVTRHVYQFFPYLLFAVFAYTVRMIIQNKAFYTLQYLGFSFAIWLKTASIIIFGVFLLFYFIYTPIQRLAFDLSFKPDNAISSILVVPSGILFLDTTDPTKKKFIQASSYNKKNCTLKDMSILEIPKNGTPKFINAPKDTPTKIQFNAAKHDYFPYININKKIQILKHTGFSTIEYELIKYKLWFLPLYWLSLAILSFFLAYIIASNIYFFLGMLGITITLFFVYEMVMAFVNAEKISALTALITILMSCYTLCGGCYVAIVRKRTV